MPDDSFRKTFERLSEHTTQGGVYDLPWPRLNSLLGGFPGMSVEAAQNGGIRDGETMAICGGARACRTTMAVWLAAHFILKHKKKVTFFAHDGDLVRAGLRLAWANTPLCNRPRVLPLSFYDDQALQVLSCSTDQEGLRNGLDEVDADTSVIILDVDVLYVAHGALAAHDYAETLRRVALERRIPILFTVQLPRRTLQENLPPRTRVGGAEAADHVLLLSPTEDRRHLVLTLACSRTGVPGTLLLDTNDLSEAL